MTTRWLVTGAGGMLGRDLVPLLPQERTTALSHADLDVTDAGAVDAAVAGHDVVVHTAAWTDVDGAEAAPEAAMTVNGTGTAHVAQACHTRGARLVHISTDYVFDGSASEPYREDQPPHPVSAYGRSKTAAERAVLQHLPATGIILRTAWLYGAHGKNFVSTMARLAATHKLVDVVDDQTGQPTWTGDLAQRIVDVVRADIPAGIYHATNAGATTWYELARAVFTALGLDPARVRPTTSAQFVRPVDGRAHRLPRSSSDGSATPAPRPAYSVLSHDGWAGSGLPAMRPWRDAFKAAVPLVLVGVPGS